MCKTDIKFTEADLMKIEGCSQATANRKIWMFKRMLEREEKWQFITIQEYADLNNMDPEEIKKHLNAK